MLKLCAKWMFLSASGADIVITGDPAQVCIKIVFIVTSLLLMGPLNRVEPSGE